MDTSASAWVTRPERPKRAAPIMYRLGERVLCYEPDPGRVSKIFPAIVNQVGPEQRSFLVHFCGWGHRWDRHVENAFLLKDTESNREFMKKFNSKAEENIPNKKTLKGGMGMNNGQRVQATSTSDVMNRKKGRSSGFNQMKTGNVVAKNKPTKPKGGRVKAVDRIFENLLDEMNNNEKGKRIEVGLKCGKKIETSAKIRSLSRTASSYHRSMTSGRRVSKRRPGVGRNSGKNVLVGADERRDASIKKNKQKELKRKLGLKEKQERLQVEKKIVKKVNTSASMVAEIPKLRSARKTVKKLSIWNPRGQSRSLSRYFRSLTDSRSSQRRPRTRGNPESKVLSVVNGSDGVMKNKQVEVKKGKRSKEKQKDLECEKKNVVKRRTVDEIPQLRRKGKMESKMGRTRGVGMGTRKTHRTLKNEVGLSSGALDAEEPNSSKAIKKAVAEKEGRAEEGVSDQWKMELQPALKEVLEKDHDFMAKKSKRHRLPASPNILQLLDQFVKDASLSCLNAAETLQARLSNPHRNMRSTDHLIAAEHQQLEQQLQRAVMVIIHLREFADALQTIADHYLEKTTLYRGEPAYLDQTIPPAQPTTYHVITEGAPTIETLRQSIFAWAPSAASSDDVPLTSSQVYGGVHLLRLLLVLPKIFARMDFNSEEADRIKSYCASLQTFLVRKSHEFVNKDYYQD